MRNYIILNGINSNTINGLLISTLPPISKPLIRTQVEEIDGRDGDIVTTLGYSAYDKQFDIGLYGNYDVNEIISYFNSKGTVVFSNEPDKYYNYQILEQIDFEKLIRFKTATVTMHIQPFKYLVDEQPIEENATEISDEGKNITLNNTNDGFLFNDFKVKGNTEQATSTQSANLFNENYYKNAIYNTNVYKNTKTNIKGGRKLYFKAELKPNKTTISGLYLCLCDNTNPNISGSESAWSIYGGNIIPDVSPIEQKNNKEFTSETDLYISFFPANTSVETIFDTYNLWVSTDSISYVPFVPNSPSPDYPSPVNTITGDVEVKVQNGNLAWNGWAEDFVSRINNSNLASITTYDNKNCLTWKPSAGYQDHDNKYVFKTKWKENTQYTFKFNLYTTNTAGWSNLSIAYTDGTASEIPASSSSIWQTINITTTANKTIKYLRVSYRSGDSYIDLDTFMVVEGTTAGEYIPHQEQNYPISLGDIELCKIGDYQDYIYKENGNWYKHAEIGKVVLDGSEDVWIKTNNVFQILGPFYPSDVALRTDTDFAKCNCFKYEYVAAAITHNLGNKCFSWSGAKALTIRDDDYSTADEFTQYLSNSKPIIYYPLATPTTTQITDTTLLEQLEALESLYSYDNITHINSDGDLAPIVFAKINTIENEQIITNAGNYFAKPKITIYGKGAIGINIDGLQVLSVELSSDEIDHITIDSSAMEAYTDNINTLRNRAVTGDYNNLKLNPGNNNLSFSGMIENYTIENYTRWL